MAVCCVADTRCLCGFSFGALCDVLAKRADAYSDEFGAEAACLSPPALTVLPPNERSARADGDGNGADDEGGAHARGDEQLSVSANVRVRVHGDDSRAKARRKNAVLQPLNFARNPFSSVPLLARHSFSSVPIPGI